MAQRYIPGVCNIGPAEIRRRRLVGYAGFGLTFAMIAVFYFYPIPDVLRLLVIIPALTGAMGFLQAWFHFCAKFGMSGVFNVSDDTVKTESVDQAEWRAKDRQKALNILTLSLIIAWVFALWAYFLPFHTA